MITDMILIEEAKFFPWALAAMWPSNGQKRMIIDKGIEVIHYAPTALSREKITMKKNGVTFVRTKIGTKWSNIRIIP